MRCGRSCEGSDRHITAYHSTTEVTDRERKAYPAHFAKMAVTSIGEAKSTMKPPSDTMDILQSTEFCDMTIEMYRLISFHTWPRKNEFPQPTLLVSAGFYYTGEDDKTKCFSCDGEVSNWNSDMYPDEVHRKRFPDCLLVKGEETRHKPMRPPEEVVAKVEDFFAKKSNDLRFISRNAAIVKQPTNSYGMTTPILVNLRKPKVTSGSPEGSLESFSLISRVIDYNDMRFEQARLRSFAHWPKSDMIQPSNLARAGMYFIGPGDRVQCAFCKGKLEGWIRGDIPLDEHRKHFGARCRFMQGAQVGNVPIVDGDSPSSSSPPIISSRNVSQALRPRYPEYADVQRRLGTFINWPAANPASRDLATAGFYYENNGGIVICFSCGGRLDHWQPSDDPWLEHAHWFPHCSFLIQIKGPEFVETVIRNYGDLLAGGGIGSKRTRNLAVTSSPTITTDVIMASEPAQTVSSMGLLRVDVERAARVWASRNNGRMPDANSLAELAMNIKEGHDRSSPSGDSALTPSTLSTSNVTSSVNQNAVTSQAVSGSQPAQKAKNFKKKKKHKAKNYPAQHKLKELAATNNPVEEEETTMTNKAEQLMREFNKLQEQRLCKVCLDEEINMVFLPCGHLVCCSVCAPALSKCPICRTAITDTVRTYLS